MDMRELVEKSHDAWNSRDEEAFLGPYDADHEVVAPGFTGKGVQGLRDFWALWNGAFPDNRIAIRTLVIDGPVAAQASTFQGTHTEPLLSPDGTAIPPTGRQVSIAFSGFVTTRGEKVVRTEFYFDQLDLLIQLGLAPG